MTATTEPTAATQPDIDPVQRLAALIEERRDIEHAIEAAGEADDEDLVLRLMARRQVLPGRIGRAIIPALEHEIAAHAATIEGAESESATIAAELPEAEAAVAAAEAALETAERARAAIQARLGAAQRVRSETISRTRACREELERQRDPDRRPPGGLTGTLREGVLALVDQVRGPHPLPSPRMAVVRPMAESAAFAGGALRVTVPPPRQPAPGAVTVDGPQKDAQRPRDAVPLPSPRHIGGVADDGPLPA